MTALLLVCGWLLGLLTAHLWRRGEDQLRLRFRSTPSIDAEVAAVAAQLRKQREKPVLYMKMADGSAVPFAQQAIGCVSPGEYVEVCCDIDGEFRAVQMPEKKDA